MPSPTDPIILSKQGPQTADNILHNYASYTYKISLLTWDSINAYNTDIQSDWKTVRDSGTIGKKVLMSSGGINAADRHEDFGLDFYIDSMSTKSLIGMSKATRASNVFEATLSVVEPNGTTLLDRLNTVLKHDNWAEFPFLIKIEFIGHNDDTQETDSPITPATRLIPVRLFNMSMGIQSATTVYSLEFIAMTVIKKGHPRYTTLETTELTGSSVSEVLTSFATIFNDKEKARVGPANQVKSTPGNVTIDNILTSPKNQQVADEIIFRIDPVIAKAEISPVVADQTMLFVKKDLSNINPNSKTQADASTEYKRNAGIIVDKRNKVVQVDKGTNLLAVIEKILMFSEYITDQLNDVSAVFNGQTGIRQVLTNPEAGLYWWKITFVPILLGWDDIRGQYGTRTIIQIDPYIIDDPQYTDTTNLPNVVRNYQYIYSGQNIDIKELELNFNNAYVQSLVSQQYTNAENLTITETQQVAGGTLQDEQNALATGSTIKTEKTISPGGAKTTKEEMSSTLLENLYRDTNADMVGIDITIIGDPAYIQQDGIINAVSTNKAGRLYPDAILDPQNGAILPDFKDVHVYTSFRTPDDYNEELGLVDFSGSGRKYKASFLNGYYKVFQIGSTFSGGDFTQTISAIRLYNQEPENRFNPLKLGNVASSSDIFENKQIANSKPPAKVVSGSKASSKLSGILGAAISLAALLSSKSKRNKNRMTLRQQEEELARVILPPPNKDIDYGYPPSHPSGYDRRRAEEDTISLNNIISTQNSINYQNNDDKSIKSKLAAEAIPLPILGQVGVDINIDNTSQILRNEGSQQGNIAFNLSTDGTGTVTQSVPTERDGNKQLIVSNSRNYTNTQQSQQATGRDWWKNESTGEVVLSLAPTNSSPINARNNIQNILLNTNKRRGIVGTESLISLEGYSREDAILIKENLAHVASLRKSIIMSSDNIIRKSYYKLANSLSEDSKLIHNKYDNTSYSWDEIGYYPELRN